MTLGQKLYNLRTKANMTQEQLAEKMNVSRQSISKWESDASRPDLEKLKLLAELYQISLDELLGKENIVPVSSDTAKKNKDILHLKRITAGLSVVSFVLAGSLIAVTVSLSAQINALRDQVAVYSVPVYYPTTTSSDNPTDDMDTFFQSFSAQVQNVSDTAAMISFRAVLKSYTDTTLLTLLLQSQTDTENTPFNVTLTLENGTFTGTAELPLTTDSYQITGCIDTDGKKQTVDLFLPTNSGSGALSLLSLTDWQPLVHLNSSSFDNNTCSGVFSVSTYIPQQMSHISDVKLEVTKDEGTLYSHTLDENELDIIRDSGIANMNYSFRLPSSDNLWEQSLLLHLSWFNDLLKQTITYETKITDDIMLNGNDGEFVYFEQDINDAYLTPVTVTMTPEKKGHLGQTK